MSMQVSRGSSASGVCDGCSSVGEVFNVTNHPSYGLPNANFADFGTIRTTVSTPRQMQFGVKLIF